MFACEDIQRGILLWYSICVAAFIAGMGNLFGMNENGMVNMLVLGQELEEFQNPIGIEESPSSPGIYDVLNASTLQYSGLILASDGSPHRVIDTLIASCQRSEPQVYQPKDIDLYMAFWESSL